MKSQQKYIEETLAFITKKKHIAYNEDFLKEIAAFLGKLFATNYVLFNKYSTKNSDTTETVVIYTKNGFVPNIAYKLANTPCENVINKDLCVYQNNIQTLFPKDTLLEQMNVYSYVGIPLWDSTGEPIGLIAVMDSEPLSDKDSKILKIVLQIVAIKVAKVLEKILYEKKIKIQEKNYKQLFEESPSSLWELDFTNANKIVQDLKNIDAKNIGKYVKENPEFLIECLKNSKIKHVNKASISLFKAKNKEHLLQNINKIANEETFLNYQKILIELVNGKEEIVQEVSFTNLVGEIIFGIVRLHLIRNVDNNTVTASISILDITKQKESEDRYRALSKASFDPIFLSENGICLEANATAEKMFGYTQAEAFGMKATDLIVPKDHELVINNILSKYKKPYEVTALRKDRTTFPAEVRGATTYYKGRYVRVSSFRDLTKSKELENDLKESEAKFKKLSNLTFEGILIHNQGIAIDVNASFAKMFGYTVNELLGKNILELLFHKKYIKIISKNRAKNYTQPYQIEGIRKNDSVFPVEIEAKSIDTKKGNTIRVVAIRDITERKKTEDENKKLSMVVAQSANSIIITDSNGNVTYTNPKFTELTGYTAAEALGENPRVLKSGNQTKEFYTKLWKKLAAGKVWKGEFQNKAKNGKLFWEHATITPIKNEEGKIINYLAIKEDLTALKKNELILKESENNLLSAQKIAKLGSFNLNLKTQIAKTSTTFNAIVGLRLNKELPFAVWRTITHPKDRENNQKTLEKCIKTGKKFDLEYRILTKKTQELKWIHGLGKVIYKNGEPTNFIGTIQDITERKKIRQELIVAKEKAEESNRLKTEFLNNMSHEIRTPMNGILGFSEILSQPNLSHEKRKYFLKIIQNSGKQLLHIINDILEISELETKQIKVRESEVCLNDLFLELFSIFDIKAKENKTPLYLKKGLLNKQSTVLIDQTKLHKILSNLLENALKFTNIGFIEFGYRLLENKELTTKNNSGKQIEIFVKDTGVGIHPENHKIIFERFTQVEKELSKKVGGLGLGLSIVKENTTLLGGEITLKSAKGKGTTFTVTIPYKPINLVSETTNKKENFLNKQTEKTILIVEDEEVNYLFLEILLLEKINLSCNLLHAKNGKEAVEICKSNTAINLVLMDIKMPIMTGIEATKLIRKFQPNLPVIAQTAYSTTEDKEKAFLAGCNDFISKPINKERLKDILKKYL